MNATPLPRAPSPVRRAPRRRRGIDLIEGVLLAVVVCCWAVAYVGLCPPDPARPAYHQVQA